MKLTRKDIVIRILKLPAERQGPAITYAMDLYGASPTSQPTEDEQRRSYLDATKQLDATMCDEHVKILHEEMLRVVAQQRSLDAGNSVAPIERSNLLRQYTFMIQWMVHAKPNERSFALPAEVAQVYIDHPDSSALHQCRDCGCPLPIVLGETIGLEPHLARIFFPNCPLCGGKVDYRVQPWFFRHELRRVKELRAREASPRHS